MSGVSHAKRRTREIIPGKSRTLGLQHESNIPFLEQSCWNLARKALRRILWHAFHWHISDARLIVKINLLSVNSEQNSSESLVTVCPSRAMTSSSPEFPSFFAFTLVLNVVCLLKSALIWKARRLYLEGLFLWQAVRGLQCRNATYASSIDYLRLTFHLLSYCTGCPQLHRQRKGTKCIAGLVR